VDVAGNDLLASWENQPLARLYVRVMTRLRMQEPAFQRLERAIHDSSILPAWTKEAVQKGMDAVAEKEWQKATLDRRTSAAGTGMANCMEEMGGVVRQYFTPEEKQQFLQFLEKKNTEMDRQQAHAYLLPLSQKAELAEFQARLTLEVLQSTTYDSGGPGFYSWSSSINNFIDFQTRRLRLVELGQELEGTASGKNGRNVCGANPAACLTRAADIFHLAGKPQDELRMLQQIGQWNALDRHQRDRYFELLLATSPQTLVDWSSRNDERGDQSAEFLLAHGQARLLQQAIDARGAAAPPVWRPAYTALTGLYFNDSSPRTKSAFVTALDDRTIGQRLKNGGDPDRALTGEEWFYYASRYGEFMEMTGNREAEDFLPGELEHTPDNPDAYFNAASTFQDYADWPHAVETTSMF